VVSRLLGGEAMPVVMIGGASMLIAALLISRVPKETATNEA
jgi:hypothetical protein